MPLADINERVVAIMPNMRAYARSLTRDHDKADVLLHDGVVRMLRFQDSFDPDTNFLAWGCTIITNLHATFKRRMARERRVMGPAPKDTTGLSASFRDSPKTETHKYDQSQAENRYYKAAVEESSTIRIMVSETIAELERLPEECRRVLIMAVTDGLEYDEIAERTGLPVGTVRSRIARGRQQLRDKLDRQKRKNSTFGGTRGRNAANAD